MNLIDTHSHLFTDEFASDLSEVISRAKSAGVSRIYMPNIDLDSVDAMLEVASRYPDYCFPMMGLHPTSVGVDYQEVLDRIRAYFSYGLPFVAVGEVGLDFHWDTTYENEQRVVFDEQIQWALELDLPLVIHCRDAYPALFEVLAPYRVEPRLRGIFHSFTGTTEDALQLLDFSGFYLGINGVVTFRKNTLSESLSVIPVSRIVLETDSPYLAPVPYRGKRNESSYVKFVMDKVSEILDVEPKALAEITSRNAETLFGIPEIHSEDFKVY